MTTISSSLKQQESMGLCKNAMNRGNNLVKRK